MSFVFVLFCLLLVCFLGDGGFGKENLITCMSRFVLFCFSTWVYLEKGSSEHIRNSVASSLDHSNFIWDNFPVIRKSKKFCNSLSFLIVGLPSPASVSPTWWSPFSVWNTGQVLPEMEKQAVILVFWL